MNLLSLSLSLGRWSKWADKSCSRTIRSTLQTWTHSTVGACLTHQIKQPTSQEVVPGWSLPKSQAPTACKWLSLCQILKQRIGCAIQTTMVGESGGKPKQVVAWA